MRSIDFTKYGTLLLTCVFMTAMRSTLLAEDRPIFQGPTGMGLNSEENLPLEWVDPESGAVLWKFPSNPRDPLLHLSAPLTTGPSNPGKNQIPSSQPV